MRTTHQSSSSYQAFSGTSQSQGYAGSESQAEKDLFLRYASLGNDSKIISGSSDIGLLSGLQEAILKLKSDYFSGSGSILIKSDERSEFDKRFLLFEHELDGLLRRRIEYSAKDFEGGTRNLDFTNLLHEKECQIIELEKKIQNFEERLRRSTARELELENKITQLNAQLLSAKDRSLTGERLDAAIELQRENERLRGEIETLRANFASAASIWKNQVSTIRNKYPQDRFDFDRDLEGLLQKTNVRTYNVNGVETIEVRSERTVEVPVMETRTKGLLHLFVTQLRDLSAKYPKLLTEFDSRISEYFSQELIDVL